MPGWIKMSLGMAVGLSPGDFVLDGTQHLPPPKKGHSPQFLAHAYCGKPAGCIRIPLATEVGLSLGNVRWGPSFRSPKGAQPPNIRPMFVLAKWLDGPRCHLQQW